MGLVYVTILPVVPPLAVSLSVLKAFGSRDRVDPVLARAFEPLGERGAEFTERVIALVDNAQGDLAGVGASAASAGAAALPAAGPGSTIAALGP
jgi:uncharacterized BrkB/YihY/UPF0761 family membrane protein